VPKHALRFRVHRRRQEHGCITPRCARAPAAYRGGQRRAGRRRGRCVEHCPGSRECGASSIRAPEPRVEATAIQTVGSRGTRPGDRVRVPKSLNGLTPKRAGSRRDSGYHQLGHELEG
jgi:hypothetical protein